MSNRYISHQRKQTSKYILTHPVRTTDLTFEDFYDDHATNWYEKAQKLQARRWRKIKHQLV